MVVAIGLFWWISSLIAHAGRGFTFTDVGLEASLREKTVSGGEHSKKYILETTTGGIAFLDYDNDGWQDVFVVNGTYLGAGDSSQQPTSRLYRNRRDGTFEDVTRKTRLVRSGWGQGVCAGDIDNDGWIDLFVTYWGQNALYRNTGGAGFEDITESAGLLDKRVRWGSGCAFLDYDRDGFLDLFVSHYIDFDLKTAPEPGTNARCQYRGLAVNCGPRGLKGESNAIFRNNGKGAFTDVSESTGIASVRGNYGLGVLVSDFNNDRWPDVYVANDTNASLLFLNNRKGGFSEVAVFAGCAYDADGKETSGMGVAAGDYNGDGWMDILKTNFSDEPPSLYRNTGEGLFVEESAAAGLAREQRWLGWGCGFLDADKDGLLDIFMVNGHVYPEVDRATLGLSFRQPKNMYRNIGGGRFENVSAAAGSGVLKPVVGRGAAFADYDNDGDVDIAVNNMHDSPSLLKLDSPRSNHSLTVSLVGVKSNRSGIGARIECRSGGRRQIAEIQSGGSYLSQNSLRAHFGVGAATTIDLVEIRWPSGLIDRLERIAAEQVVTVKEAQGIVKSERVR